MRSHPYPRLAKFRASCAFAFASRIASLSLVLSHVCVSSRSYVHHYSLHLPHLHSILHCQNGSFRFLSHPHLHRRFVFRDQRQTSVVSVTLRAPRYAHWVTSGLRRKGETSSASRPRPWRGFGSSRSDWWKSLLPTSNHDSGWRCAFSPPPPPPPLELVLEDGRRDSPQSTPVSGISREWRLSYRACHTSSGRQLTCSRVSRYNEFGDVEVVSEKI